MGAAHGNCIEELIGDGGGLMRRVVKARGLQQQPSSPFVLKVSSLWLLSQWPLSLAKREKLLAFQGSAMICWASLNFSWLLVLLPVPAALELFFWVFQKQISIQYPFFKKRPDQRVPGGIWSLQLDKKNLDLI